MKNKDNSTVSYTSPDSSIEFTVGSKVSEIKSNEFDYVPYVDRKKKFFSIADLVTKVILVVLAIGLFSVLLGNNFSFSETAHRVLSSDLEPYDFNEWLSSVHSAFPENPIGTVLSDIVILPSTIIYVLGFAINLLIALF